MNVCLFSGNLTHNVELRHTTSGTPVANFSIAVKERYKSNGKTQVRTTFVDMVAWGKTAEFIAENFQKGSGIVVTSSARQEQWETAEGLKRSKIVFNCESVEFPVNKGPIKGQNNESDEEESAEKEESEELEEVPF